MEEYDNNYDNKENWQNIYGLLTITKANCICQIHETMKGAQSLAKYIHSWITSQIVGTKQHNNRLNTAQEQAMQF